MTTETTSEPFFNAKYAADDDPWQFASSNYEQSRYVAILLALAHRRYHAAFEPGCSIGVLTAKLAGICDAVQASDISLIAVDKARLRCKELSNVEIVCGAIPDVVPQGPFDLIVLSEIGYYLNETQLAAFAEDLTARLRDGGVLLAAHWLGESHDHILTGDRVHELLHVVDGLVHEECQRYENFRLDRWVRG